MGQWRTWQHSQTSPPAPGRGSPTLVFTYRLEELDARTHARDHLLLLVELVRPKDLHGGSRQRGRNALEVEGGLGVAQHHQAAPRVRDARALKVHHDHLVHVLRLRVELRPRRQLLRLAQGGELQRWDSQSVSQSVSVQSVCSQRTEARPPPPLNPARLPSPEPPASGFPRACAYKGSGSPLEGSPRGSCEPPLSLWARLAPMTKTRA
eukprot:1450609-Pyramimonas_sp.AAC.2